MRPHLAPYVKAITYETVGRDETVRDRILPQGRTSLWVLLNRDEFRSDRGVAPAAFVAGPDDAASVIELEPGRVHISVEFTAAGAAAFFRTPLADLRNQMVPLAELWGVEGTDVQERLLTAEDKVSAVEQVLIRQLIGRPDPAIARSLDWIHAGSSLADVTSRLGLLPRTFRRRFVQQTGITPKRYARVRRLQRVVRAIDGGIESDWAQVAARHGYCDQAHLIDEFRDLVGVTPAQYVRHRTDGPNHLMIPADQHAGPLPQRAAANSQSIDRGRSRTRPPAAV
jgi:AraC-like DNA-binding protein